MLVKTEICVFLSDKCFYVMETYIFISGNLHLSRPNIFFCAVARAAKPAARLRGLKTARPVEAAKSAGSNCGRDGQR
jgi:hypothetical protein